MSDAITGLAHVNIRAPEALIERVRVFYRDVIGLREGLRPPFRSRGHWLYAGERDVLHLTIDPSIERMHGDGWLDHIAFSALDLDATIARLDAAGVAYERDDVPSLDQVQLFLTDPAGIGVELNFSTRGHAG